MSIELKNITFTYMKKSPFEKKALDDITMVIPEGKITAIAGHTGSGKSTLIQHLNGLLSPDGGQVIVDGVDITVKKPAKQLKATIKAAKGSVGMVFQYPEQQLFEETVAKDIAFGPANQGLKPEEIDKRVREAMKFVNLDYAEFANRSPFTLSGGQMRRAAIAGILALHCKYLVLDEPTAGLDPKGREEFLKQLLGLKKKGVTIILVSHNMDDIARFADNVIVMTRGRVVLDGAPNDVFKSDEIIQAAGLDVPEPTHILEALKSAGLAVNINAYTIDAAVDSIIKAIRKKSCERPIAAAKENRSKRAGKGGMGKC